MLDVKHDGRKIPKWEPMYTYEGHESSGKCVSYLHLLMINLLYLIIDLYILVCS